MEEALIGTFNCQEAVMEHVRTMSVGFAVSVKRSRKGRSGEAKNIELKCDRGGKYQRDPRAVKRASSRLTECPFAMRASIRKGQWHLFMKNNEHNHDLSEDMSGHSITRRLSVPQRETVKHLSSSGVPPKAILSHLRSTDDATPVIAKTVYNELSKIRKENLANRTPIQALLDELGGGSYKYDYEVNESGNITRLFFAHNISIAFSKRYPHILLMDATYKTNRFRMPLLNVVGIDAFNSTFYSCFAFLNAEQEADYRWALTRIHGIFDDGETPHVVVTDRELALLNALADVFPKTKNILCLWHIEKNVLKSCKKHFATGEEWDSFLKSWTTTIKSKKEEDFNNKWAEMKKTFVDHPRAIKYLEEVWMPFKEHFAVPWTNQHLHLGTAVTSRVEGAHAVIKRRLLVSPGDLRTVVTNITMLIEHQEKEHRAKASAEKIRVSWSYRIPLMMPLLRKVSIFALNHIYKQYLKVKEDTLASSLPHCTGTFGRTMGLPCAHSIKNHLDSRMSLQLDDVHVQWHITLEPTVGLSTTVQGQESDSNGTLRDLLGSVTERYNELSPHQKFAMREKLIQLINDPLESPLNPLVQLTRGRPMGSKNRNDASTRRDPSAFELVERPTISRRCRLCSQQGHNSRTCPSTR